MRGRGGVGEGALDQMGLWGSLGVKDLVNSVREGSTCVFGNCYAGTGEDYV